MKRLYILVFLLLSAFYAVSNEQMGGYSSSGQMVDGSVPNSGSDPFPQVPRPRLRQQGEVTRSQQLPSMQRQWPEESEIKSSPGSRPLGEKSPSFTEMPELVRPEVPTQQMAQSTYEPSPEVRFQMCLWFYRK